MHRCAHIHIYVSMCLGGACTEAVTCTDVCTYVFTCVRSCWPKFHADWIAPDKHLPQGQILNILSSSQEQAEWSAGGPVWPNKHEPEHRHWVSRPPVTGQRN